MADRIITLSSFVSERLYLLHKIPREKISVLFLPDLAYTSIGKKQVQGRDRPLRVLFVGRILPYKGLPLFVTAAEKLRREGVPIEIGVFGAGAIEAPLYDRLAELGAAIGVRWLKHHELNELFQHYEVVVAPHTEASQSGVISAAFGAGLPVVATPVGGLVEQVQSGRTGLLTEAVTSDAIAAALKELAENRALLASLYRNIEATRPERSMSSFLNRICELFPEARK
jgi:glycosyltransferase involved in cell wall biosynthesis